MATLVWTIGSYSLLTNNASNEGIKLSVGWKLGNIPVPRRDGEVVQSSPKRTSIPMSLQGRLHGSSATALRTKIDTLESTLAGGRQQLNVFDDRYMMVTPAAFEKDYPAGGGMRLVNYTIDLLADDPFWISETLKAETYWATQTFTLTNSGNAPTFPKFTVTAPAGDGTTLTTVSIANNTASKTFTWTGDSQLAGLSAGQTLVVDMEAQTIAENGTNSMRRFSGNFFNLASGDNEITITSTNSNASVLSEWRDRWY